METFSALLALCAGNSPVPVNSPHKGQWRGALMFSLICAWINDWVNNRQAGDLRRHCGDCDVNVMTSVKSMNKHNIFRKMTIIHTCCYCKGGNTLLMTIHNDVHSRILQVKFPFPYHLNYWCKEDGGKIYLFLCRKQWSVICANLLSDRIIWIQIIATWD